ncbi:hypothetical protein KJ853_04310 [Patescibacteria group bacterium]|nr:hypothetical protein [Patescibacteria group bacterium]
MTKRRFAFIVHLRDINDIAHTLPVPNFLITKVLRRPILWLLWKLRGRLGFMVRSKFRVNDEVEGYIIVIWMTGAQMMNSNHNGWVRRRILETILYVQDKLHCDVIGLGALTASVTNAGQWLSSRSEVKAAITHGDTYAVALALEGVETLASKINLPLREATVAIVGATGIIGDALSRALARFVGRLILVGRNEAKLQVIKRRVNNLDGRAIVTTKISDVKEADIVVTATSWPEALIKAEYLKEGAIVYEVSQPRNVSRAVVEERPDVLVVDGSYARVPEDINFWWMSLPPHHTFGCMAETLMQCLEDDRSHHIGAIDLNFVETVRRWGQKHGFTHADFTSFNRPLPNVRVIEFNIRHKHEFA